MWVERPLVVIVRSPSFRIVSLKTILAFLEQRFREMVAAGRSAVRRCDPKTSVGKFDKKVMRAQFKQRPGATAEPI
jgi:fatty-acyl-CoA synthase